MPGTGSTEVGRLVLGAAAQRILRCSLELGGNAPFVILAGSDVADAVAGAVHAKLRHSAQTCTAADRFYVHDSLADEFTAHLAAEMKAVNVGSGFEPTTQCGPLIDRAAVGRVQRFVDEAAAGGAEVISGGAPPTGSGSFFAPTVLAGASDADRVITEEIFGPVAPVLAFSTVDEVLTRINTPEAGLAGYVLRTGPRSRSGGRIPNRGRHGRLEPSSPIGPRSAVRRHEELRAWKEGRRARASRVLRDPVPLHRRGPQMTKMPWQPARSGRAD